MRHRHRIRFVHSAAVALAVAATFGYANPLHAAPETLPNFATAGYHAGAAPLPHAPAARNVRHFGASPDGITDLAPALDQAIASLGPLGGVITIPPGRWLLSRPVHINRSRVVIRGAGRSRTIIVCPNSLEDLYGQNRNWSWSGGMLWSRPTQDTPVIIPVATLTETALAGTRTLTVRPAKNTPPPRLGEWLELQWFNDMGTDSLLDHLYGGVIARDDMGSELQESTAVRVREWVKVVGLLPGRYPRVIINQALRIDARPEWKPTLMRAPYLTECGIEALAFAFPYTTYPGHHNEKGYNAINMLGHINSWVRDVAVFNGDSGIFCNNSRYVTIKDILLSGENRRKMHHGVALSWSQDCKVTDWRFENKNIHATTLSWAAHGNVYANGWGYQLAMDAHRACSFMNLHTNITIGLADGIQNPFRSGGSYARGPHTARDNVYWNVKLELPRDAGKRPQFSPGRDWPLGVFVGWHAGARPIRVKTYSSMGHTLAQLNQPATIPNLYAFQRVATGFFPWLRNRHRLPYQLTPPSPQQPQAQPNRNAVPQTQPRPRRTGSPRATER